MKKKIFLILISLAFSASLAACSGQEQPSETVVFGDAGWDSMKFHNAVARYIAEAAYGLDTDETSGSTAITYGALKTGDIQVYTETWQDSIRTYGDDVAEGSIKELGINYDDNIQGIYVPRYLVEGDAERGIEASAPDLRTVEDLKDYPGLFTDPDDTGKGRIYGAISGWAADEIMRNKFDFYGLDEMYNYIDPGSDAALAAAITGAYERGEPIVAYYWEPAWITGQYDLLLLEDAPYDPDLYLDGQCEFPSIKLTVCVNPEFYEAQPEFCEFLSRYSTSSQLTSEALAYVNVNDAEYGDAAEWFLRENDSLLDQWLEPDKAELVRAELAK